MNGSVNKTSRAGWFERRQKLKQAVRYFIGAFEALLALFALMGLGAGLLFLVQVSIHPGVDVQRIANVRMAGVAVVESAGAAVFGLWLGRLALRNLRAARAKVSGEEQRAGG